MEEPSMQQVSTIGVDLAKNVFQVHAVDSIGKPVVRRQLRRSQFLAFFEGQPHCLIGMEACAGAHHWGRTLQEMGHEVRLMPPSYVKPYVKRGMYGWLLRGKGYGDLGQLVGCGHVFVVSIPVGLRALMNVRVRAGGKVPLV
jgi:hypothetical protein